MSYNYLPRLEEYNELVHKKIHQGLLFTSFYSGTIEANTSVTGILQTGNDRYIHANLPDVTITNDIIKVIWRRGGSFIGGVDIPIINNNDNSTKTHSLQSLKMNVTVTSFGTTVLKEYYVIGGNKVAGSNKQGLEYILKPNTTYSLTFENIGNSSIFYSYERIWYETDDFYPYSTPNEY